MDAMDDMTPAAACTDGELGKLNAQFESDIAARAANEEAVKAKMVAEAKESLTAFEAEREAKKGAAMQSNREKEQARARRREIFYPGTGAAERVLQRAS